MMLNCRCCGHTSLERVFDLGDQPLANAYTKGGRGKFYPLALDECENCNLIQLSHVVDPTILFKDYAFRTGTSQRMVGHFAKLLNENAKPDKLTVEIASNDGSVLATLPPNYPKLGIDPADNLCQVATAKGIPCVNSFFTESIAKQIASYDKASLIVACNVLAHVDDLNDFCKGVKHLLTDDGTFIVEVPDANNLEFDTIYHEHLSYFRVKPLATLLNKHGLTIHKIESYDVHGGSIRLYIKHSEVQSNNVHYNDNAIHWPKFKQGCEQHRRRLQDWFADRDCIIGYGAPAKATVRLNYCGITADILSTVVDSTPEKQGKYIPGTGQIIRNPSCINTINPTDILILAPNHKAEIIAKLLDYTGRVTTVNEI